MDGKRVNHQPNISMKSKRKVIFLNFFFLKKCDIKAKIDGWKVMTLFRSNSSNEIIIDATLYRNTP